MGLRRRSCSSHRPDRRGEGPHRSARCGDGAELSGGRPLGEDLHTAGPIDLVLFDCPPTLGLLAVSALVAAHEVVVPVGMGSMELDGVADLLRTVELVAQRLNAGLRIGAVIPTGFQSRQRLSQDVLASLTERFGDAVLSPIRASVRVREAPSAREPLTIYAPTEPVTEDFRAVTTALLTRGASTDAP